ncbi:MAG: hypothetical protein RL012_38 [Bacteroidota bacterium]|jgi:lysyl-tRNA synthetase class 2
MTVPLSEQEVVRIHKKQELEALGINPYPAATFVTNTSAKDILVNYLTDPACYQQVVLAGRLMSRRIMGSASFAELQDSSGKIQLYVHRDTLCPEEDKTFYNTVFKKLMDMGDIVGVHGHVFKTKMGTISVHVTQLTLLTKALKPLPIVKEVVEQGVQKTYDAFTAPEKRYRQRYVDLIVNPHVRETFIKRAQLIRSIRQYLEAQGYLEVETPILQPIYGGAAARPFKTHHNTLDTPLYLRIANELYLKRLIVGGYDGVYEFAKDFRNEGMSRFHNPEFTMLEVYVAYKDYLWMMDHTEALFEKVALDLHGTTEVQVDQHTINFQRPWKRFTLFEAIQHFTGIDVSQMDEAELRDTARKLGITLEASAGQGKIIDDIFGAQCEPNLIQPTFITDYPIEMSPLAKRHRNNPALTERFEVICNGKEICNAFSELNDPIDQRQRFEDQLELSKRGDEEAMALDEDFLRALRYGMPPTVGLGIGIDRLAMIMTDTASIQEVIFFPQMKPENKA